MFISCELNTWLCNHFEIDTAIVPPQPLRNPIPWKGLAIRACWLTLSLEEKGLIRVAVTTRPF